MIELQSLARKLYALASTLSGWAGDLDTVAKERRARAAKYLDSVADTLSRAWDALSTLSEEPDSRKARREAERELGRIAGYVDTFVEVLEGHLDGRKLAGVKRRLKGIDTEIRLGEPRSNSIPAVLERLSKAEGYFRALADRLRA